MARGAAALLLTACVATPVAAQQSAPQKPQPPSTTQKKPVPGKPRPPRQYRGFIAAGAGIQAIDGWSDSLSYPVNAETATTEVEYSSTRGPLFDVGAGWRFWKTTGIAVGFSRMSLNSTAQTVSEVPHPFFDQQPRHVEGEAGDIERVETAVHAQLFWVRDRGKWRTRVLGGATYFSVDQDLVTRVYTTESYPFDTAEFHRVDTERASGSGVGVNIGVDVAWMMTRAFGFGGGGRFTYGTVDLNSPSGRSVSTDAGGAQGTAGIRIAF